MGFRVFVCYRKFLGGPSQEDNDAVSPHEQFSKLGSLVRVLFLGCHTISGT